MSQALLLSSSWSVIAENEDDCGNVLCEVGETEAERMADDEVVEECGRADVTTVNGPRTAAEGAVAAMVSLEARSVAASSDVLGCVAC